MKSRSLLLAAMLAVAAPAFAAPAFAADATTTVPTDEEVLAQLKDLQKEVGPAKRDWIKEELELTPEEGSKFWPVYDAHQAALEALNKRRVDNILAYSRVWNAGHIEAVPADKLVNEAIAIERAESELMQSTYEKLKGSITPVKLVRYLQIESKLRAFVRVKQAAEVPLAQ
jgi:Spy/CpxP family protein refolding chaperone